MILEEAEAVGEEEEAGEVVEHLEDVSDHSRTLTLFIMVVLFL